MTKALVCIKRVIDHAVAIRVKSDKTGIETQNVKMSMNPFDAVALEATVQLKEKNLIQQITAVSIGCIDAQETLRHALALGADKAVLVHTDTAHEPLIIAKILQSMVQQEQPDLIVLGKQAIDDDCHQTGQILAGLLNYPQAVSVSAIHTLTTDQITVEQPVETGSQTLVLTLPAVITVDLSLAQPRYASLINIMQAKKKPLDKLTLSQDIIVDTTPRVNIIQTCEPLKRSIGKQLASIKELHQLIST